MKTRWSSPAVVLGLVLFLVSGCGDDKSTNPGTSEKKVTDWPLEVGNWWKYEVRETEGEEVSVDTVTVTVVSTTTVFGNRIAYELERVPDGWSEWLVCVNGEMRAYYDAPTGDGDYTIFLKEPIRVGTTWAYATDVPPAEDMAVIRAASASVTVPGGVFSDCVHVEVVPDFHTYIDLSVGFIKISEAYDDYESVESLLEYHLGTGGSQN